MLVLGRREPLMASAYEGEQNSDDEDVAVEIGGNEDDPNSGSSGELCEFTGAVGVPEVDFLGFWT